MDAKNKTQTLKPQTSNAQLKSRINILKNLKSEENDYQDFVDQSQEPYGAGALSNRSYKSMTSRKFPKVSLSVV